MGAQGRVLAMHRYPVKSLAGEQVDAVEVDRRGLVGDRLWAVETVEGRLASGKNSQRLRRRDRVFELAARTDPVDGAEVDPVVVTFPGGQTAHVGTPRADVLLRDHLDERCRFVVEGDVVGIDSHQDSGQVSIIGSATLDALADLVGDGKAVDPRRLRVNVVIETTRPWVEEGWVGRHVLAGGVDLAVTSRVPRCRMVDAGHVGVERHGRLLRVLSEHRDLCAAVYARVASGGVLRVDDDVCVR